jgi:hypothetical protein
MFKGAVHLHYQRVVCLRDTESICSQKDRTRGKSVLSSSLVLAICGKRHVLLYIIDQDIRLRNEIPEQNSGFLLLMEPML